MLSTENPPSDLCEISQLKSDEGGSDGRAVDLFKSAGLDYNNPLPNFSIRDYVFSTRSKDIKNNWPFSEKNLQLCLKHGAKDVLPPFQSVDSVRNPSAVDTLRSNVVKYPEVRDGTVCKRPAVNIKNINSSECEEDKEFPSTTTSQSCSGKPEFAVRECKKAETNIQSPAKKCRLIVKLNTISEPKSAEDSAVNTPVISETMASKVCPVCKTFSSSSNTTLNAHIDQCLSSESVDKWTTHPKVIKRRIKPRKTRLMVDIYEAALHSTLEDLDKRNGTSWASNMGLHSQDLEACAEEGTKAYSPVNIEDINQEGAVYIDSSGTKLRILSKLTHMPSKSNDDSGPSKFVKGDKGTKVVSSKKKKKKNHTVQKFELQKNSLSCQGSCSPIPDLPPEFPSHSPKSCYPGVEVNDGQRKLYPSECDKEEDPTKSSTASDHMKSHDFGMVKQWVGSKRSGIRKTNPDLDNQLPDKSLKSWRIKSVSSLGDRRKSASISPISSDDLPVDGFNREESLSRSIDGRTELPCQRKEPGFSSLRSKHLGDEKNHLMSSKSNAKQSRKDITSVHERLMGPPNTKENHASSCSKRKMGISNSPKNESSFIGSSTSHHRNVSSEGRRFSSLRSKLLSVRHASGAESKKNLGREFLSFKNPRLHHAMRSDDKAVVSQSALHAEDDLVKLLGENATLMEKDSCERLTNRTRVLNIRKDIRGFVNTGEQDMTSEEGSETSTQSDSYIVGNKMDSVTSGSVPVNSSSVLEEEAEMLDDFVCEPTSTNGEVIISLSKSLDSACRGLTGSNVAYDMFHSDQEMFCADNVGKNLFTPDNYEMAEMDGDESQGDYFVDVDPIPIPGPPGSFLPSPGRMESEEQLRHSSLTTCRIQSSEDGHGVVDMDSSDSPVSAMSTVSNSVAGRSSSISTAAQSHFQHESQLDIIGERTNPAVEGSPFEQIGSRDRELNLLKSKTVTSPDVTREGQNIQPCCCSRKDISVQGSSLNYQESLILRQRNVTSLSVLAPEKEINDDTVNESRCYELREETFSEKEPTHPVTRKDLANSPVGYSPLSVPHNSEAMFRACGDGEFPSPSTSNPVLRLMGKNLMVVNKDDNLSSQTRPSGVRLCVENGFSTRNNPNESNSFHHMLSECPPMFDNIQPQVEAPQFDFNSSQLSYHPSTAMFSSMSFGNNATSAPGGHEYAGRFSLSNDQHGSKMGLDASADKPKEIIIIDDSSESEAGLAFTHCLTNMEGRESMLLPPESRLVNPFYGYPTRRFTGSPAAANRNTKIPASKGMIGKWSCIPEGSTALQSNSSTPSSLPSSLPLRSIYFSPRFS